MNTWPKNTCSKNYLISKFCFLSPGGGIINAVVGGIADGLGLGSSNNDDSAIPSGLNVDLGPVLDAVATLLRGPIRSAIANRRSEFLQQRSTNVPEAANIRQTRRPLLPKIARERGTNPNFIPIGRENPFLRQDSQRPPPPKVIPLRQHQRPGPPQAQQRNANGN